MDGYVFAVAAVGLTVAQTVKGITGFGSALIAMPVLLSVLPPAEAILVLAATDLVVGFRLVLDVRDVVRWPLVVCVFAGMATGQWVGTELLVVLDPVWVARLLGGVVLVMGARSVGRPLETGSGTSRGLPAAPGRLLVAGGAAGVVGGTMAGLVGAGGPPVVLWMRRHFEDGFGRAHLIAIFNMSSWTLLSMLVVKGADTSHLLWVPLLLVPSLAGSRVGAWLAPRLDRVVFARVVGGLLALAGVALLMR